MARVRFQSLPESLPGLAFSPSGSIGLRRPPGETTTSFVASCVYLLLRVVPYPPSFNHSVGAMWRLDPPQAVVSHASCSPS